MSEVKCEQCDKVFNRVQAYNSHVSHVHGSLPISKHFCPLCKTVIMATLNQFKQHRRQCNKDTKNQPIECEICGKVCNNLKGYTIHKLFHDTRNFTTSTGEKIASDGLNSCKGSLICEVRRFLTTCFIATNNLFLSIVEKIFNLQSVIECTSATFIGSVKSRVKFFSATFVQKPAQPNGLSSITCATLIAFKKHLARFVVKFSEHECC